jgi:hypothetical protein
VPLLPAVSLPPLPPPPLWFPAVPELPGDPPVAELPPVPEEQVLLVPGWQRESLNCVPAGQQRSVVPSCSSSQRLQTRPESQSPLPAALMKSQRSPSPWREQPPAKEAPSERTATVRRT